MPTQREVDEAAISQQVEKIVEGIQTKDLEGLKQLYATNIALRRRAATAAVSG